MEDVKSYSDCFHRYLHLHWDSRLLLFFLSFTRGVQTVSSDCHLCNWTQPSNSSFPPLIFLLQRVKGGWFTPLKRASTLRRRLQLTPPVLTFVCFYLLLCCAQLAFYFVFTLIKFPTFQPVCVCVWSTVNQTIATSGCGFYFYVSWTFIFFACVFLER